VYEYFLLEISAQVFFVGDQCTSNFFCWRSVYEYFIVGDQCTSIFFVGDQ
jgi:hypothetical protein